MSLATPELLISLKITYHNFPSHFSSVYYNIEVINHLNIYFIVIVVTITESPT